MKARCIDCQEEREFAIVVTSQHLWTGGNHLPNAGLTLSDALLSDLGWKQETLIST